MIRKSWYITWENGQRKGSQNLKQKEIKKYIPKRRTLDSWLNYLGYVKDDFCISYSWFLFQTTHNRYFFSRIRLVLFPTLYKFIVWASWAKTQSCLGFNPKLVLIVMILFSHLLHIFSLLKRPMHHLVFQHIFTFSVHICINQRALILIFLLFVSPLTQPLLHIFSSCFFHFCIPAKSLILAVIDWNAQNWPKFHPR